ncbi:MAG: 30S ribosomal protein S12 methylthiotransferase RimO [Clostridiales bacterium]|nr:30S ribosomal protein S12 methylthiotransferase RimO [Clostridiales bacterium]
MKVGVVSLGCAKNRVDTEEMLSLLSEAGYGLTDDPAKAEVLIVNTCGFITPAKEESIDAIFEMAQYKETGACKVLAVTGCLAQRYADALMEQIPQIDVLVGVTQYDTLADAIGRALKGGERQQNTQRNNMFLHCGRVLTTPPYSAYIRIGEGCDNRCAYCAIPLIRGGHRSRPEQDILEEMRTLAGQGVKEHILIAQDTTRWGRDLQAGTLQGLLRKAARVPGVQWLRLLYCYPDETDQALIDEMTSHPNVCRYLDLPLQHAVPRVLKAMNRRGDIVQIEELLHYARDKGFALRTTFIVGFPGETEEEFQQLLDFTARVRFDRMGAFAFSPEEDTAAALLPGQIPEQTKKHRLDRLMALQADISLQRNQQRVGSTERVLITGRQGSRYTARSAWEAPDADGLIYVDAQKKLVPGAFAEVCITGAQTYDLTACLLEECP